MTDSIRLPKVGEQPSKNKLPRGVTIVQLGDRFVFVKGLAGRLMPLPQHEQEKLAEKLGWLNND